MAGKHRADKQPDGKSTSEQIQGKRDDASKGKHRDRTAGSDVPPRGQGVKDVDTKNGK